MSFGRLIDAQKDLVFESEVIQRKHRRRKRPFVRPTVDQRCKQRSRIWASSLLGPSRARDGLEGSTAM